MIAEFGIIYCASCDRDIGTVTTVPEAGKTGHYSYQCVPSPMPTKCPECADILIRKPEGLT